MGHLFRLSTLVDVPFLPTVNLTMSSTLFSIQEHTVPCQHIREYPRATSDSQEDVLHLSLKQYRPLNNPNPQYGDVTMIAAHANGFPKVFSLPRTVLNIGTAS